MKKLIFIVFTLVLFLGCKKETPAEPTEPTVTDETANEKPAEFADAKYTEIGKSAINAMAKGDMDGWTANFADDAVYYWNAGDSLVGKPAIDKYWRDRRATAIETISFESDIWLPIKVNKPQQNESTVVWLMGWYQVNVKYKGGSDMSQGMHILYHFNENDKIDQVNHFIDRAPIIAAMPKK